MAETRAEYLARISAEFPGAQGRIDDLMRQWDHANPAPPAGSDTARTTRRAVPKTTTEEQV